MKPLLLAPLLLALLPRPAAAQQLVPPLKRELLDSTFAVLPSAEGAHYRRETEYADSVGGERRDYYISGQLQSREHFAHFRKDISDGISEYWYPDGKLQWHMEYSQGQRAGETRFYYPGGQLKRRETYAAGERKTGECFAADGRPVPFFEYQTKPVYPKGDGGEDAVVSDIGRQIQYPKNARRAGITGTVEVSFMVDEAGNVADIKLVKSVFPSLDQALMQAVGKLRRFAPGRVDGKPARMGFVAPFRFSLK